MGSMFNNVGGGVYIAGGNFAVSTPSSLQSAPDHGHGKAPNNICIVILLKLLRIEGTAQACCCGRISRLCYEPSPSEMLPWYTSCYHEGSQALGDGYEP